MIVKLKILSKEAIIPTYAKELDSGVDLTAISAKDIDEGGYGYIEYGTGLAIEIPEDYVGLLFPRSSISNTGLILANAVGVIDPGYTGEVKFRFKHIPNTKKYNLGDRIGQLIIIPRPKLEFEIAEDLAESDRGDGGFGSTN